MTGAECGGARDATERGRWLHLPVVWLLFFLICMGLGYPTLNRYDPRDVPGLYDAKAYYAMVTNQPLQRDQADLGHRVLVPYLARPIYKAARNHLHTWDPAFFALLVVNAFFTATTALLILLAGYRISSDPSVALLGGFVFLANFAVGNLNLSAYVDSAVNCMLMAMVWSMLSNRWWLLPVWGVLGALAKETFVPMCVLMALSWWFFDRGAGDRKRLRLVWVAAMTIAAFAALTLVMARVAPYESPLAFAASRQAGSGSGFLYLSGLARCLTAGEFLLAFCWLLPLGVWRLNRLPKAWVAAAVTAGLGALAMGAYDDALGNAARAVFSAVGPLLSVSVALLLADLGAQQQR